MGVLVKATGEKAFEIFLGVLDNLLEESPQTIIIRNTMKLDDMFVSEPIGGG